MTSLSIESTCHHGLRFQKVGLAGVCRQIRRQSNVTNAAAQPNSLQSLEFPFSSHFLHHLLAFVLHWVHLCLEIHCVSDFLELFDWAGGLNWPIPGLVIHPRLACHLFFLPLPSTIHFRLTIFFSSNWLHPHILILAQLTCNPFAL